ncbi:hypothetical protein KJ707_00495 [Patescibacteria group bacterium]|nr:hypothetical protein [Patescibacteria group bacterium]MBU1967263.1 hypothetical protein [Patescibacteria group bacterium]MBU2543035.1 hypothetical protein [Patescibacteria group bacterium]
MNESICFKEIDKIPTQPSWPEIIGPFYKIDGGENVLSFCRKSWQAGKIPFLYGRKQIGKTGIFTPYLNFALGEGVTVFETGSVELPGLNQLPQKLIILASVHGKERENDAISCANQIRNICESNSLFNSKMFSERQRIELRLSSDDVDNMVYQLTGLDPRKLGIRYRMGRKGVISAFHQDRPIRQGIDALKELLGDKFPKW